MSMPSEDTPGLNGYDGVIILGGPQQVWEEDKYPWLRREKAVIKDAVLRGDTAILGLCFGHQLIADSLDVSVSVAEVPEVGIMPGKLTLAGEKSSFFDGLEKQMTCLQTHGAEVIRPSTMSDVLATSDACNC